MKSKKDLIMLGDIGINETEALCGFHDEKEADGQKRFIYFNRDEDRRIEELIHKIPTKQQKAIIMLIQNLTNNQEFFGFNLKQLLRQFSQCVSENARLPKSLIAKVLFDYKKEKDYLVQSGINSIAVEKQLQSFMNTATPKMKKDNEAFQLTGLLCVLLGFSMDILVYGRGKHFTYPETINEEKLTSLWWDEVLRCEAQNEKFINVENICLKYSPNVKVDYTVVRYSGCYQLLKKDKTKYDAVKQLIEDLAQK